MQRGKIIWYTLAATSMASLLLLGSGAILAFKDNASTAKGASSSSNSLNPAASGKKTEASNQTPQAGSEAVPAASPANVKGDYRVVALGDSLTRGMGDETGQGYIGNLTAELQKTSKNKVITSNMGINGMQAPELLQYVQSPDVQKEIKSANLITLSIGGNDLVRGAGSAATNPDAAVAEQTMKTYLNTLDKILQSIRTQNEKAPILFVGLYNPFPLTGESEQTAERILLDWNLQSSKLLAKYPHTLLIPTQDLFVWNGSKLLSTDQFHPNAQGYKAIATRMLQDLQ